MEFDKDQVKLALIYQYLEEVDQELAQKFKKKHKPASLGKLSTVFNDMILHFVNTNEDGQKVIEAVTKIAKSHKKKMPTEVPSKKGNGSSNKEDSVEVPQIQTQVIPQKKSALKKLKSNLKVSSSELPAKKSAPKRTEETTSEDEAPVEQPIIKSPSIKPVSAESGLYESSSSDDEKQKNRTVPIKSKSVKFAQIKTADNLEESDSEHKATEEKSKPAAKAVLSTKSVLKKANSLKKPSFTDENPTKKSVRTKAKQSDCKDALPAKKTKASAQLVVKPSSLDNGSEEESADSVKNLVTATSTKKSRKTKSNSEDTAKDESSSPLIDKAPAKKESSVEENSEDQKPSKGLKRKTDDAAGGPVAKKSKFIKFVKPEQHFDENKNDEENEEESQSKNKFGGRSGRGRGRFRGKRNSFRHGANENRDGDLKERNNFGGEKHGGFGSGRGGGRGNGRGGFRGGHRNHGGDFKKSNVKATLD